MLDHTHDLISQPQLPSAIEQAQGDAGRAWEDAKARRCALLLPQLKPQAATRELQGEFLPTVFSRTYAGVLLRAQVVADAGSGDGGQVASAAQVSQPSINPNPPQAPASDSGGGSHSQIAAEPGSIPQSMDEPPAAAASLAMVPEAGLERALSGAPPVIVSARESERLAALRALNIIGAPRERFTAITA